MSEETPTLDSFAVMSSSLIDTAAEIVCAYVRHNPLPAADLPAFIASVHAALVKLGEPATAPVAEKASPAAIRASIRPDALISFEDGKPYKTLRRHLTLRGLTPEAYKAKWGLPADYPFTSAAYSAQRSELAKSLGLGQQRRESITDTAPIH